MRKTCGICQHSVEVNYTIKGKWGNHKTEYTELFCIAAPPSVSSNKTSWGDVVKGCSTLCRYKKYPVVSESAPCSLYTLSSNKKKIDAYKAGKEKKKQEVAAGKEKKKLLWEGTKEEKRKKKIVLARIAVEKREEREKALKSKLRKIQQKKYRDEKKNEKEEAVKIAKTKANEFDRFEIIDLEE